LELVLPASVSHSTSRSRYVPFWGAVANAVAVTVSVLTAETMVIRATSPLRIFTVKGTPTDGAVGAAGAGAADAGAAAGWAATSDGEADAAVEAAGLESAAGLLPPEQDPIMMPTSSKPAGIRNRFFL
jgi:hypothetical protein